MLRGEFAAPLNRLLVVDNTMQWTFDRHSGLHARV